jgi:hypothetical protein
MAARSWRLAVPRCVSGLAHVQGPTAPLIARECSLRCCHCAGVQSRAGRCRAQQLAVSVRARG